MSLEANLEALAKFHPEAAAQVAAAPEVLAGQWSPARSGQPTVRRRGVQLCSAFDPVAEAAKAVPPLGDADFVFLPGLGAGYLAEAAAAQGVPVVIGEPDASWFREVLQHRDLSPLWNRVVPLIGPASAVGTYFSAHACPAVVTIPWRPLAEQHADWHREAADELTRAQSRAGVNAATFKRFGTLWRRNLARNEAQAEGARPLSALKNQWAGCRAVVCAAGPSLADTLDWIAQNRTGVVLIAVDTAWPALERRGLEPDVVVVLDGQYWNGRHLDRALPERTLAVTEWTGPPRAFRVAPGRVHVAASSLGLLRRREADRWGELGRLPTGGSVATAAWSLALHLGCTEVAFAGLDLGYPGGTHVRGSQFEETALRGANLLRPAETLGLGLRGTGLVKRPAVGGGWVWSDARMDLFRGWLSSAVASRPDVRVVNLSPSGSVIPGIPAAPPGYGGWPALEPRHPEPGPVLQARPSAGQPPWDALEACLKPGLDEGFASTVDTAWNAARAYWDAEWDAWAGRERVSWDTFPSMRTRRRLVELLELTLLWRAFWETE